jgi:DNA-binding CsgD family transcriptional regulator
MVVSRERRDFSERDRAILNLFRSHMVAAYEMADRFSRLKHDAFTTSEAVESMKARLWLERHLPVPDEVTRLPELLERWLERIHRTSGASAMPDAHSPLRIESADEALEVRHKKLEEDDLLLLECREKEASSAPLESLGLTPREAQVLYWVTEGKKNAEIGVILGTSARTVQKHLERLFRTLGVETRTAAAMRATEVWRTMKR